MWQRSKAAFWQFLIACTQMLGVLVRGVAYTFALTKHPPNADETTSSRVGRNAIAGRRWALAAEAFIDGLFGGDHCRSSIERDEA